MAATDAQRTPIVSPAVWRADDVADSATWTIELTNAQREELASVARDADANGRTLATITVADAPLPSMADVFAGIVDALSRGRGFVLLRGFPVDLLSANQTELAYFALGLHLGTPVGQDAT